MISTAYKKKVFRLTNKSFRYNGTKTPNINEFGVQMINESLRSYLFGNKFTQLDSNAIAKAKMHLKKFDLLGKDVELIKEVDNLKLPRLMGLNIDDHFKIIANSIKNKYFKLLCSLASSDIPKMPDEFEFSAGWTRYEFSDIFDNSKKFYYYFRITIIYFLKSLFQI